MSLYKFIKTRLDEMGMTMNQLMDNEDIANTTINRIKVGGAIKDSTKQKLAHGLKCCIGDINAAIAQMDDGPAPEKVEDIVLPDKPLPVQKIPADVYVEMYKQRLMDKLITLIAQKRSDVQLFDIYADFGEEVAKELFGSKVYVAGK